MKTRTVRGAFQAPRIFMPFCGGALPPAGFNEARRALSCQMRPRPPPRFHAFEFLADFGVIWPFFHACIHFFRNYYILSG
jgi:hypothetical protein